MTEGNAKKIVGITREELSDILTSTFESHRGQGYFYNDADYDDPASYVIIYDKFLSRFDDDQRRLIEGQINTKMSEPSVHRIMDQGCGHANTLREITLRFGGQYSAGSFFGYGVSANLEAMWLGHKEQDPDLTEETRKLVENHGIHSFSSYRRDEDTNVHFFGIEDDIYRVMKDFPYELDLVISDNTYFHLVAPWMALKRTVDKLSLGGVAMVRTILESGVDHISQRPISREILLTLLQRDNPDYEIFSSSPESRHPVLTLIKKGKADFKTNIHLSLVSEGEHRYIRSFYSTNLQRDDLIAIDTF